MGLDEILNFAIPTAIVLVVFGWIYFKLFKPYVLPLIQNIIDKSKGDNHPIRTYQREIVYE